MTPPELRIAVLEWCVHSAGGGTSGLGWVDATVVHSGRPFAVVRDDPDRVRFSHVPYGAFLPAPMVDAAIEAQAAGEATALEGVLLAFARPEWLVSSRPYVWTAISPIPQLLVPLVESYGPDGDLHRADPAILATAIAHLPTWYPYRGGGERAAVLCESALDETLSVSVSPGAPDEVFSCRGAQWWRARGAVPGELQIRRGVVQQRITAAPATSEDVVLKWREQHQFSHELLRLLPVWSTARVSRERSS